MPNLLRLAAFLLLLSGTAAGRDTVTVYAAASLGDALQDIAREFSATHAIDLRFSFAGSGTLARQIAAGAPAQVFASADAQWMDYLQQRGHVAAGSRRDLLGNSLVLIAPAGRAPAIELRRGFDLAAAFSGALCTGETTSVPAGIYAREALQNLGWWDALAGRLVGTDDVRAALAYVERGECALGIVYRTDAARSRRVTVIGEFPAGSHRPVVYPFALLPRATPAARTFFGYLAGAPARATFIRHGFVVLPAR